MDHYRETIRAAGEDLGMSPVLSQIFCDPGIYEEGEVNDAVQDFRNVLMPLDENNPGASQVPRPKSPGFSVLLDLLSPSGGYLTLLKNC